MVDMSRSNVEVQCREEWYHIELEEEDQYSLDMFWRDRGAAALVAAIDFD